MPLFPILLTLLLLVQVVGGQEPGPALERKGDSGTPDRLTSNDDRVVVYGKSSEARSAILSQVTKLRKELQQTVQNQGEDHAESLFPLNNNLIITLYGEVGDPAPATNYLLQPRRVEGSERFRIELSIHLAKGLNRLQLRKSLLEALLMDRCLNQSLRDDQPVKVAPWLIVGVLEKMAWRDRKADRGLYKAMFKNGLMMDVEELLTLKDPSELDAAQRTTFQVSAGAFVMAMLTQDDGSDTFLTYLAEAPTYEGEPLLLFLNSFFTGGLSNQGLAKWWALQLANLTQDFVTETLTPLATEALLEEVLLGTLEDEKGMDQSYRLMAYQDILALSETERKLLLGPMIERLGLLSFRCFPSYHELLTGYARVIKQLLEGDAEGVEELLNHLEAKRAILKQVGERTRDYLDWFQIVNATELTGEFADYRRLKSELETQTPPHPGPVGRYLNAVQALYDE